MPPTYPYHSTPTPDNWRQLILDIDEHILFIRQHLRRPRLPKYAQERLADRLTLYPRALRALYEVEAATGWTH